VIEGKSAQSEKELTVKQSTNVALKMLDTAALIKKPLNQTKEATPPEQKDVSP